MEPPPPGSVLAKRASDPSAATNAEAVQAKMLANMSCPGSSAPVDIVAFETTGHAIRRGAIFSRETRKPVGKIEDFQIDFVRFDRSLDWEIVKGQIAAGALPKVVEEAEEWRLTPFDAREIELRGERLRVDDPAMIAMEEGSSASFEASGEIELMLFAHPWSGIAEIRYLETIATIDLYEPHTCIPRPIKINLGKGKRLVEILASNRRNPVSLRGQCLFGGYQEKTGRTIPLRHHKQARIRGAEFRHEFWQLLAEVPQSGILLDVGGGNRQIDDPRYANYDYAEYREPDLIGDATQLPFRDSSIDAVYSSGVFEHISDPIRAGAEVARVLKPGGRAIIGWAFMQPIHSEGQHFYNATPWGVARAFGDLRVNRSWYDTSFAFLVEWGADVSGLHGLVPAEEISRVCEILKRWDGLIPEARKSYMANGIWAEFEKVKKS